MRGKTDWLPIVVVAALAFLVLGGPNALANIKIGSAGGDGGTGGVSIVTTTTTLTAGAIDTTGVTANVNGEIYADDLSWSTTETQMNSLAVELSSSAPQTLEGYLMVGNDNGQSATDRGSEVYYRMIPFEYNNEVAFRIRDKDGSPNIKTYNESTPTWTGYDDGAPEATLNVTIGASQTLTSTELKFIAGADGSLGNPDFSHPLAICFNVTTISEWDEIRPLNYVGEPFEPCDAFDSYNMLGKCYILPTEAVQNYGEYRFHIVLDPATGANPAATDNAYAFLIDYTWYKDDQGMWKQGWCDNSASSTDKDPGIAALGNGKIIYFT